MRLLSFTLLALFAVTTQAATFNVSTTPELRTALETAATNGEDDTIILAAGSYSVYSTIELGSSDSDLIITGDPSVDPSLIVLDGAGLGILDFIFRVYQPQHKVSIKNLTIQNASASAAVWIGDNNLYPVEIINTNFQNNANQAIVHIGSSSEKIIISHSSFFNNSFSSGFGGAISSGNLLVRNSVFEGNSANLGGGAIACTGVGSSPDLCIINTSKFIGNSCGTGQNFYSKDIQSAGHVFNSIFDGKNSLSPQQPAIQSKDDGDNLIANNLFINNALDLYIHSVDYFLINNVFNKINTTYYGANLYHNVFWGENPIIGGGAWVDVNNTYNSNIAFNESYETTAYDLVVSKGFDPLLLGQFKGNQLIIDAMQTDYAGNSRVLGTIDIGQLEYEVDTSPQITNMTNPGNAKVYNELTITFDVEVFSGRTVQNIYFDDGDGYFYQIYQNQSAVTFNSSGNKTLRVKVIDSAGEETIRGYSIEIADFTTEEAFQYVQANPSEFNLVTAADKDAAVATAQTIGITEGKQYVQTNPSEFNLVTAADKDAAVATAQTTGITEGKQYVQTNPSEFNLVTAADKDAAVATAQTTGITEGKQYVQTNPSEFNLIGISELKPNSIEINNLPAGWSLISTRSEITDLTIFNGAAIIWVFDGVQWKGWSSNSNTLQKLQTSSTYGVLTAIPANSGIWVSK